MEITNLGRESIIEVAIDCRANLIFTLVQRRASFLGASSVKVAFKISPLNEIC